MTTPVSLQLLNTEEAAYLLRLSPNTLRRKRCEGTGPRFVRLGSARNAVRYRPEDLEAWLVEGMSTSDFDDCTAKGTRR